MEQSDIAERLAMRIKVGMMGMPKGMNIVSSKECLAVITRLRAALRAIAGNAK